MKNISRPSGGVFCKKDHDMHRTATGLIVYNIGNLTKI
ncbi:hypothetical protein CHCC14821_2606 [Bacillus paralicheniformis]|nr:hypothetical protein CHCC14821_2606 [Bacillus paralicheniformis]